MKVHKIFAMASSALLGLSLVGLAWAQPVPEAPREEALELRKRAEDLERAGKYIACAEPFTELYRQDPDAQQMDQVLDNAGVCFEMGKSVGWAMQAYSLLEKRFPQTKTVRRAIIRRASLAASVIDYRHHGNRLLGGGGVRRLCQRRES